MAKTDSQVEALFQAGAHLGHKTNRIHPKAKKYIYTMENGTSIIDLTKTVVLLEKAKDFLAKLGKERKKLLVVVTKKNGAALTQDLCQKNQIPFITVKWPAGLLTNFDTMMKNIKKMRTMKEEKEKGEWQKFVKHEQVAMAKELNRLNKFYGGLADLEKLPDALFLVDTKKEKNAVKEALETKVPVIAIVDTNVNPDVINYPIPANDDSIGSIEYLVKEVVETYAKAKK